MNFSWIFIHRPVGTTLLTIAIALSGALAYQFLPVSPLPQVDYPVVSVNASLPGASPEIMASAVATPLERQFGRIAGINEMTSSSQLGQTSITMQFDLSRNIDAAARDVQAAINAARGQLPSNLPGNPTYRKVNPAEAPILILALTSDVYSRGRMYDAASSVLAQKLSQVKGVGQINVGGGALPAVRVEVNPTKLNTVGLGLEDVRTALGSANANLPIGSVGDSRYAWTLKATDQLLKASQYQPMIIAYHNGVAIRLSDVADVTDSVENIRAAGTADGKPAILMVISRQPGANIISTADAVLNLMPVLQAEIPAGMKLSVVMDRTTTIRASVHDTQLTLLISMVLVVLVVFFFLRDLRTTFIPSVAVPVSLIGTFGVMYLAGYSVDTLSLMALAVATGFVVDDAIVVIENITRHIEQGIAPMQAALLGAREIGFTVLSMSTSLVAVFIPVLLMGGLVGRLFREFAVVLSVAIGVSLIVSLTTTPMLCALMLRPRERQHHGRIYKTSQRMFDHLLGGYKTALSLALRHPLVMIIVTLATVVFTFYLYVVVPKGFFPQQDTGRLNGNIQADQHTSYQAMQRLMGQFVDGVRQDPAVQDVVAFVGGGLTNRGFMFVTLKPIGSQRRETADQVVNRLRGKLAHIPGATLYLVPFQDVRVGGRSSNAQFQYTLRGDNLKDLTTFAPRLLQKVRTLPGLADVNSDQQDAGLEASLTYDRATAARLGITPQTIDNVLYDAFGQRQVSTMYYQLNQYHVVMEVQPSFWQNADGLKYIYIPGPNDAQIPLSTIAHYAPDSTALSVNHQGQFPAVTISFNLLPGVSLGQAADEIDAAQREIGLPPTVRGQFAGTAQVFQDSLASQPYLIIAAIIAVYIVLGMLYESLVHPVTILSTLPSAGVGALLALIVCHTQLDLVGLIGIILLIGIVKKNAIMMIDFALDQERTNNKSPRDAIYEACVLRFRPIMMTTMAALFGGLPLALARGTGAELRRPLGIAIVGGLVLSQMLTLFTTPIVYLYLDRFRLWSKRAVRRAIFGVPTPATSN
ncbi:MAG: multidrug efflux RND transporter permease subunit [Tepidisphaeraceae bacterium]